MLTETEIAYAAGLFDGEGHVGITATKNGRGESYHRLMINVTSTDRGVISWLSDRWEGVVHKPRYFAKETWREAYRWSASDGRAMAFLSDVLPYLQIKRGQAELAIQFQQTKTKGGFGSPKPDLVMREDLREKISTMNKAGGAAAGSSPRTTAVSPSR